MAKTNDWVATLLSNGDVSMQDIIAHGITPDNTAIQSEDYYKDIPQVKEAFTDENGNFDETRYDNFYRSALSTYNDYADGTFEKELIQNIAKDPFDWTDPLDTNRKTYSARIQVGYNPDRRAMGIGNVFEVGGPSFSMREVAQANLARDENGEKLDWTPNEKGGLFKAITRPTLALATWDEDGTHEINGVSVVHKKGEYKYDENGDPYYEMLGDKEGYDKDILHWTDTITVDGSKLNSIDFMDSDGLTKSIMGTVTKTAVTMAPLLIPGVGQVYGTVKAVTDLAKVMPTLAKAVSGIVANNNDGQVGSVLTRLENYMSRYDSSTSDYARDKFLSFENVGNIFSESAGQLFSQRQIWNIAKAMKLGGDTIRTTKIGQQLSLGYMALTSSKEAYADFKRAGADDRTAGLGMLAVTSAMYGLMSQDYFRKFLFQDTYMSDIESRDAIKKFTEITQNELLPNLASTEVRAAAAEASTKTGAAKFFNTVSNVATKAFKAIFAKPETASVLRNMWHGSINEATEEVMEEVSTDAVKGIFAGLDALGIPTTKDDKVDLDFGITFADMMERYATSFFGGFLGGATFQGYELFENRNRPYIDWKKTPEDVRKHIAYLISTGHGQELEDLIKLRFKNGGLGNKNLSAKVENGRWITTPNNEKKFLWGQGSETDNQNMAIYTRMIEDIKQYRRMIENGILFSPETFNPLAETGDLFKQTEAFTKEAEQQGITVNELIAQKETNPLIEYIFKSGLSTSTVTDDIVDLNSRIIEAGLKVHALEGQDNDDDTYKTQLKNAKDELKALYKERDDLVAGNKNYLYAEQILFTVHPALHSLLFNNSKNSSKPFAASNVQNYVKVFYDKKWSDLSENEQKAYREEYNNYMASTGTKQLKHAFKLFTRFNQLATPAFMQIDAKYKDAKWNSYYTDGETFARKANISTWEENKLALEDAKSELEQVNEKIAERINQLGATSPNLATDQDLLFLNDQKGQLINDINELTNSINDIESHITEFLDATPTESGLHNYVDKVLSLINNKNASVNDLYEALNIVAEYYEKLAQEKTLSDNDTVLNRVLEAIGSTLGNQDLILIRETNIGDTISEQLFSMFQDKLDEDTIGDAASTFTSALMDPAVNNLIKSYYNALSSGSIEILESIKEQLKTILKEQFNERRVVLPDTIANDDAFDNWFNNWLNGNLVDLLLFGQLDTNTVDTRLIDTLTRIGNAKSNVLTSPVFDLLSSFNLNVNNNSFDILQTLEAERNNLILSRRPSDYVIGDPYKVQALRQLLDLLNLLEAETQVSSDGYNETINQFRPTGVAPSAVLSEITTNILAEDIDYLRKKITSLLNLSDSNTIDKVKIQKDIEINCYPKFLTAMFQGADLPETADEDTRSKTIMYRLGKLIGLTDKTLLDIWNDTLTELGINDLDYKHVTEDNYKNFRKAVNEFESKLRTLATKVSEINEEFATKLVDVFGKDVWKMSQTLLSRDPDYKVTDYQTLMYLASIFADDSKTFYGKYINAISDSPYSPFFNQEFVIRQVWGTLTNKKLYSGIVTRMLELAKASNSNDAYLQDMIPAINSIFVDGGTGTGKSTAIASTIVKMLGHDRVLAVAPTELLLDAEKGSVGKIVSDANHRFLLDIFIEEAFGTDKDGKSIFGAIKAGPSKEHIQLDQAELDSKVKDISSLFGENTTINDEKVIVIDEGSLMDEARVQALLTIAKKNNIEIIFLGDNKQNSAIKNNNPSGYFDTMGLVTTMLAETVRADNQCKVHNYRALNSKLAQVVEFTKQNPDNNTVTAAAKETMRIVNTQGKIKLTYNHTNNRFCGEQIVPKSEDAKSLLDEILRYPGDNQIVIITDSKTDNYWRGITLPNNVSIVNYTKVQGGEYDYAIIDHDFQEAYRDNSYLILRDLYTLVNRSKKGSVVVDSSNSLRDMVENSIDPNGDKEVKFDDTIRDAFKAWKTDIFSILAVAQPTQPVTPARGSDSNDTEPDPDEHEGTDLAAEEFTGGFKGDLDPQNTGGKLPILSNDEIENIRETGIESDKKQNAAINRANAAKLNNAIDYDAFGDWCDNELITHDSRSAVSLYANFVGEPSNPNFTDEEWQYFVKYISSIVIDDIHDLESYDFGGNPVLNDLYRDFIEVWDSEQTHTFYQTADNVLSYAFKGSLIPVAVVNSNKKTVTKYTIHTNNSLFKRTYGMCFLKNKDGGTSRAYIANSCKHLYHGSTFGIFALEGDSTIAKEYHRTTKTGRKDKDGNDISFDATANFEKNTRGKTEAMFTHNLYYATHDMAEAFLYDKDDNGRNKMYTRGNAKSNTLQDMCALRTVQHTLSLQDLVLICDAIQYVLSDGRKRQLPKISMFGELSDKVSVLNWVEKQIGRMDELEIPTTSDAHERREKIKNNFKLLSTKYQLVSNNTVESLITQIYRIFRTEPGYESKGFQERLFNYIGLLRPVTLSGGRLLQYGYRIKAKDKNGKEKWFYLERNNDHTYSLYDLKDGKPNSKIGEDLPSSLTDPLEKAFEKIQTEVFKDDKVASTFLDSIKSDNFKFTLLKHITDTSGVSNYYLMNAFDLIFKLLNIKNLDINKLGNDLLNTEQFKEGIYVRDASSIYFTNDDRNSAFKQFYPDGDLINQYSSDFALGLAPVYKLNKDGSKLDEDSATTALDKKILGADSSNTTGEQDSTFEIQGVINNIKIVYKDGEFIRKETGTKLSPIGGMADAPIMIFVDPEGKVVEYVNYDDVKNIPVVKAAVTWTVSSVTIDNKPIIKESDTKYSIGSMIFDVSEVSSVQKMSDSTIIFDVKGKTITIKYEDTSIDFENKLFRTSNVPASITVESGTIADKVENTYTFTKPISVNSSWIKSYDSSYTGGNKQIKSLDFDAKTIIFTDGFVLTWQGDKTINSFGADVYNILQNANTNQIDTYVQSLKNEINNWTNLYNIGGLKANLDSIAANTSNLNELLNAVNNYFEHSYLPYKIDYNNGFVINQNNNPKLDCLRAIKEKLFWDWTSVKDSKGNLLYNTIDDVPFDIISTQSDLNSGWQRYLIDDRFFVLMKAGSIAVEENDVRKQLHKYTGKSVETELDKAVIQWINDTLSNNVTDDTKAKRDYVKQTDKALAKTIHKLLQDLEIEMKKDFNQLCG